MSLLFTVPNWCTSLEYECSNSATTKIFLISHSLLCSQAIHCTNFVSHKPWAKFIPFQCPVIINYVLHAKIPLANPVISFFMFTVDCYY